MNDSQTCFQWPLSATVVAQLTVHGQPDAEDIDTLEEFFRLGVVALRKAARVATSDAPGGRP